MRCIHTIFIPIFFRSKRFVGYKDLFSMSQFRMRQHCCGTVVLHMSMYERLFLPFLVWVFHRGGGKIDRGRRKRGGRPYKEEEEEERERNVWVLGALFPSAFSLLPFHSSAFHRFPRVRLRTWSLQALQTRTRGRTRSTRTRPAGPAPREPPAGAGLPPVGPPARQKRRRRRSRWMVGGGASYKGDGRRRRNGGGRSLILFSLSRPRSQQVYLMYVLLYSTEGSLDKIPNAKTGQTFLSPITSPL